MKPASTALTALAATLAIQTYTSIAATAPAVLAPVVAGDFGIAPTWIGVFVGLLYAGAMMGSLASGEFVARYGAIRVSQVCVIICAVGVAVMAVMPAAAVAALIVAAVVIGIGYGPITAASSELLSRTTPPDRMALVFSIKQTGVPAGAAIAGALLPVAALAAGWRGAFLAVALLGVGVAIAAEPSRKALDTRNPDRKPLSLATLFRPIRTIVASHSLPELSLAGLGFAGVQMCLASFLVVYLTDSLQWSLVASGLALTFTTFAAVPGRIIWGAVADHIGSATGVLAAIGAMAAVCGAALAFAGPDWSTASVLLLASLYGFAAIGWNGVQLSELARRAPPGMAATITGASGFITFGGVMLGPVTFAALVGAAGYPAGFGACATVSGLIAAALVLRNRLWK